jgi:hypothetical protein
MRALAQASKIRADVDAEHTFSRRARTPELASAQPIPRPSGTPFQPTQGPSESGTIHPQQIKPGTSIGRWQIVRQLGGGGMAEVYLAQAHGEGGFEKQVAIKVMHPHLARDERTIAHFLDEARLAAGITHQNVVAIQDLGRIGDDYFIVMEYIDGLDLEHLLASARAAGRAIPLNVGLGLIDAHDHTTGKGVRITPAAMNINADLSWGEHAITNLGKLAFSPVTALVSGSTTLFVSDADEELYWRTSAGTNVRPL